MSAKPKELKITSDSNHPRFTVSVLESALNGDREALLSVPKTDLHSHSVLACHPEVLESLIGDKFRLPDSFGSLGNFLSWVGTILTPLIEHKDLAIETLKSAYEVLRADGVTHAEISLHLPLAKLRGTSWSELAPHLEKIKDSSGIKCSFELGVPRPISDELLSFETLEALDTGLFHGIDIYDDELFCSLDRFQPLINQVKSRGMYVKVHSGEVGDPKQIWDDIRKAEPDAIQHGVRAVEDPELIKFLAREQIPLHICPTSNVKLGIVSSLRDHPIRKLFDAGVLVTVNTDDYVAFGSSVSDEFEALYRESVFDSSELEELRQNGFSSVQRR